MNPILTAAADLVSDKVERPEWRHPRIGCEAGEAEPEHNEPERLRWYRRDSEKNCGAHDGAGAIPLRKTASIRREAGPDGSCETKEIVKPAIEAELPDQSRRRCFAQS